ncbi:MAG TPA: metalloregulator ArsR/SmtB family transcription factor [Acidimicrobiales bacterium]|nr:metalloregulator ArsR/SmtB family transcription factor [Acidimicrobiales bacterium]
MPAPGDPVGAVLGALADPTRRAVFEAVSRRGPLTATTLATELPVTRQAVAKHLERLADAGLVRGERVGRETRWSATPAGLRDTERWLRDVGAAWDDRLERLGERARQRRPG